VTTNIDEITEAEIMSEHPTAALATRSENPPVPTSLFGTDNPAETIRRASEVATALADVIRQQDLSKNFGGDRDHVFIEGWQLLGAMVGIYAETVRTEKVLDENGEWAEPIWHLEKQERPSKFKAGETYLTDVKVVDKPGKGGWKAFVEMRRAVDGVKVGAAEMECRWSERNWGDRDSFQVLSMAQTRAASKGYRIPLGFVMTLAGYSATPAEEMDGIEPRAPRAARNPGRSSKTKSATETGYTCPHCGSGVEDRRATAPQGKPKWACTNDLCGGGGAKKQGDGRWPWASFRTNPTEAFAPPATDPEAVGGAASDPVARLHTLVAQNITGGDMGLAETLVLEAANEVEGLIWPDSSISAVTAIALYLRAKHLLAASGPEGK